MTKKLRWLHLSDIHFRTTSKLDQGDAFIRIHADLARRVAEGIGPDLIFVTGDLVHSGQSSDFEDILRWLDKLCSVCILPRDRVFFCPGNHDSDISVAPILLRGCWRSLADNAALQSFVDTPEFQTLKGRQAAYRGFVETFYGAAVGLDRHELHSEGFLQVGSIAVGVLSVNSSLFADGGPDDRGNLQVGIRLLEDPCQRLQKADVRFVLIHHPFDWLATFESDRAEALMFDSGDILLSGHVHQRKLSGSLRGGLASTAGAVWDGTAGDYEYSFGLLECDSLSCTIESVRYMQQTGDWMVNRKTTAINRNRDESCTPSLIWARVRSLLDYPAQMAAVLSGYSSELAAQSATGMTYLSTERILAERVRSGAATPATGVIDASTLLMFYGHRHLDQLLQSELQSLQAYDHLLKSESQRDERFGVLVRSREASAERVIQSSPDRVDRWSDRFIRRLVSEGDSEAIGKLADSGTGSLLSALKAALAEGARDPFEAWLGIKGPSLDAGELSIVASRLAARKTADLAAIALGDLAERFPTDARSHDALARIIGTEVGDPRIYERFRQALVKR